MIKTVSISIENQDIIIALFAACKFKEVSRIITGGLHHAERLNMTFEGKAEDYSEAFCVVRSGSVGFNPMKCLPDYNTFHSLRVPEGYYGNSYEKFLEKHNQRHQEIEVKPITQ